MAAGLSSEYDEDYYAQCLDCELEGYCCDDACEGRIWVAKCGSIDYQTGQIANIADFCEPLNITTFSHSDNSTLREKQYRRCKKRRIRGMPDFAVDLSFDICQSDFATGLLLGRCAFDFVAAPKGNNLNFQQNPSIFDQQTKVFWGRIIGDTYTWEYPDDDCQNTSRTFLTDLYCWETQTEALIQDMAA